MSTRSTINVKTEEGIKSIYCHFDGYPKHHLPILKTYYNTQEKAEALVNLGNASVLDKSIDCPAGHSFETPVKGYCIFYGRDRHEQDQQYYMTLCISDIVSEEFNYIFEEGKWSII